MARLKNVNRYIGNIVKSKIVTPGFHCKTNKQTFKTNHSFVTRAKLQNYSDHDFQKLYEQCDQYPKELPRPSQNTNKGTNKHTSEAACMKSRSSATKTIEGSFVKKAYRHEWVWPS